MKKLLLILGIILGVNAVLISQIKRQYVNTKKDDRTEVVKEEGTSDMQILSENFADVKPGAVIRISTEKAKQPKTPKPKEKTSPVVKPKIPAAVKKQKLQEKVETSPPKLVNKSNKKKKRRKLYFKKKKRKRVAKRKKYSCFKF